MGSEAKYNVLIMYPNKFVIMISSYKKSERISSGSSKISMVPTCIHVRA